MSDKPIFQTEKLGFYQPDYNDLTCNQPTEIRHLPMQHDPDYEQTFDQDISQNLKIDRRILAKAPIKYTEKLLAKLEEHKEF